MMIVNLIHTVNQASSLLWTCTSHRRHKIYPKVVSKICAWKHGAWQTKEALAEHGKGRQCEDGNKHVRSKTRMRGKAQPDGRPAVELIETPVPVLLFSSCGLKNTCITAS